jgi:hypothetical protein
MILNNINTSKTSKFKELVELEIENSDLRLSFLPKPDVEVMQSIDMRVCVCECVHA